VNPEVLLFDMGGVLIEVDAARRLDEWTGGRLSAAQFWPMWLASLAVKRFETGKTSGEEFAREAVVEFGLDLSPEAFLEDFKGWLVGPDAGAMELLDRLDGRFRLASLSNSSPVHWPMIDAMFDCRRRFQDNFPTCELGVLKPDPKVFDIVIERLGVPAGSIWFFDDNQVNVDAAVNAGMKAWRVQGAKALTAKLEELLPGL
jgi:glucose-1-phosphatase